MAIPHNINNLIRTDTNGEQTEDLTGGILPEVDGSNLLGVIGNTYLASVDPGVIDDGFGSSVNFPGTLFQIGQSWFNYTTEKLYQCVSNVQGKARWNENLQSFGSNFIYKSGSTAIDRGSVLRLDDSGSFPSESVVLAAIDGDEALVGIAAVDAFSATEDITFQAISLGITKVLVSAGEAPWTRGEPIYLSALVPGQATSTPTSRLIGYAARAANTGTVLRDIFVGFGSGGGGAMGDLHTVVQNKKLIEADYTLDPDYNGIMAGPVTIDVGVTLEVPLGCRLVII